MLNKWFVKKSPLSSKPSTSLTPPGFRSYNYKAAGRGPTLLQTLLDEGFTKCDNFQLLNTTTHKYMVASPTYSEQFYPYNELLLVDGKIIDNPDNTSGHDGYTLYGEKIKWPDLIIYEKLKEESKKGGYRRYRKTNRNKRKYRKTRRN